MNSVNRYNKYQNQTNFHFSMNFLSRAILVHTKGRAADCSGVLCPLSNVSTLCSVFESAVFSVIDVQFALSSVDT